MWYFAFTVKASNVTPLAGVWIEIDNQTGSRAADHVTPLAGVWIEIASITVALSGANVSLPSRECGLKFVLDISELQPAAVTPLAGVWIEIVIDFNNTTYVTSLPSRECGLKYQRKLREIEENRHSPRGSVD